MAKKGRNAIQILCKCGCGVEIKNHYNHGKSVEYVLGHHTCKTPWKPSPQPKLCKCGCGEYANPGKQYLPHHHSKELHVSEETKKKISISSFGKVMSKDAKNKMSISQIGNKNALGNRWSLVKEKTMEKTS
jgi:hypothetical protein